MKILTKVINFLIKFFTCLFIFLLAIIGIFCSLAYFSDINQHKNILEKIFSQQFGQTLILKGPIEFDYLPFPRIKLNEVTVKVKRDKMNVDLKAKKVYFNVNWRMFFSDFVKINGFKAEKVKIVYWQNDKANEYNISEVSGDITTTCCDVTITSFFLSEKNGEIKGDINISLMENDPVIKGLLSSNKWKIETSSDDSFFDPLLLNEIAKVNVDWKIETLMLDDFLVKNVLVNLKPKDKKSIIYISGKEGNNNFSTKIYVVSKNQANVEFLLNLNNDRLKGTFEIKSHENSLKIDGKFNSQKWSIPLAVKNKELLKKVELRSIFGENKWAKNLSGRIIWNIEDLVLQNLQIKNATIKIDFNHKVLTIVPQADIFGGNLHGKININLKKRVIWTANIKMNNASANTLNASFQEGVIDFEFAGESSGDNINDIISNLSGKSLLHFKNVLVNKATVDSRYVNLFSNLFKRKNSTGTFLECAVGRFVLDNGIIKAENSIGMQTSDLYILGTGKINLNSEHLDLLFTLYPRSQIDVEVGALDKNVVKIKGNFNDPEVITSSESIVREGGTILLGIATGGISLLAEKLFKIATQRRSPCETVLQQ